MFQATEHSKDVIMAVPRSVAPLEVYFLQLFQHIVAARGVLDLIDETARRLDKGEVKPPAVGVAVG